MTGESYLSLPEVARRLAVHDNTVRRWIRLGELPSTRVGLGQGRHRIFASDLDIFVRAHWPARPEHRRVAPDLERRLRALEVAAIAQPR
jgi:excisionase family DNA binding protein